MRSVQRGHLVLVSSDGRRVGDARVAGWIASGAKGGAAASDALNRVKNENLEILWSVARSVLDGKSANFRLTKDEWLCVGLLTTMIPVATRIRDRLQRRPPS